MTNLLPEYEQQFATLTAEITSKICLLSSKDSNHVAPTAVMDLETLIEDSKDLLERMELEVRECADPTHKQRMSNRVQSHKVEFVRLQNEYTRAKEKTERTELLGAHATYGGGGRPFNDDMRQQLLQDNDKLEVTSARLTRSYQVALETEAIGAEILGDLHHQRTGIQHARDRLREADQDLDASGRVLSSMLRKALQHRFIVTAAVAVIVIVIIVVLFASLR